MRFAEEYLGPFPMGKKLTLSKTEKAVLARAAAIAEQAASHFEEESFAWQEWKSLEMHAAESAGIR